MRGERFVRAPGVTRRRATVAAAVSALTLVLGALPAGAPPVTSSQHSPDGAGATSTQATSSTTTTVTPPSAPPPPVTPDRSSASPATPDPPTSPPPVTPDPSSPPPGRPDASSSPRPPHSDAAVERAAVATVRAFGRQPYQDTVAAAAAEAASRRAGGCSLSDARLAGMMLAITFTEAGPLASSTVAPSPMTLSRWDGSPNLYSFGSTATAYRSAFWHPGVGLWQFDHPWQNTAAERIDTAASAQLAAQVIAARFCSWTPSTGFTQFAYAVRPWHGCDAASGPGEACRTIFVNHFLANGAGLADDSLQGFALQDGVTRLGGAQWRWCQLVGQTTPVFCLYVDPAAAQGSTAWTNPAFSTNPISSPFYVIRDGAAERRYWLGEDSGYAIDITASTTIGSDPRTTIAWASGRRLCDLSTLRGACELRAPSWKRWRYDQVSGSYSPLVGDFDGNGNTDIFWYGPGGTQDVLWLTRGDGGSPVQVMHAVSGTYTPLVLDVDGNGLDDIVWYAPGDGPDVLWAAVGGGAFRSSRLTIGGDYDPLLGDFDGNGRDDVLWYAPTGDGVVPDLLWLSRAAGGFAVSERTVADGAQPFVGDFDGDTIDDIFWYRPGTGADELWFGRPLGAFVPAGRSVGGTYQPLVGDFDRNGLDDVFWYGPGATPDSVWVSQPGGAFVSRTHTVGGTYRPVVGDISGNGHDDIVWYAPGAGADSVWLGASAGAFVTDADVLLGNDYLPLVGDFDMAAGRDIFWYAAGPASDGLWFD